MSKPNYTTSDPFLVAFIRLRGHAMQSMELDVSRRDRKRIELDLPESDGIKLEMEYRNSDFRKFVDLYRDTMDLVKRR